ncbi:MAG: site-specific integrase [Desulfosalsimonadaceae bacterium]
MFTLETAMRRGELVKLTWGNVDFKGVAHLPETKNEEARSVPLSPRAVEILQGLIPHKTTPISGSVFGLGADYISYSFARACKKAGIEDLRFHDLRHEATSRFFEDTDLDGNQDHNGSQEHAESARKLTDNKIS